jgi:hypothetical protein
LQLLAVLKHCLRRCAYYTNSLKMECVRQGEATPHRGDLR